MDVAGLLSLNILTGNILTTQCFNPIDYVKAA